MSISSKWLCTHDGFIISKCESKANYEVHAWLSQCIIKLFEIRVGS